MATETDALYYQIDKVVQDFDAATVRRVMLILDWSWYGEGTPTESAIRSTGRQLLETAVAEYAKREGGRKPMDVSSGGLCATIIPYKSSTEISLSFVTTEAGTTINQWELP